MKIAKARKLATPLTGKELKKLRAGDWVLLSGEVYAARDQAHKRLVQILRSRGRLPLRLKNEIIFYVGPTPARPGRVIGSAGPTTSSRMDPYTPALFKLGLAATIGKGERSQAVKDAIKKYGAVYFVAVGGIGAYLSERITKAKVLLWPELGPEAVYKLTVRDFPCLVAYDARGGDYFADARNRWRSK
jgi:fumarate hydratase subunit beta